MNLNEVPATLANVRLTGRKEAMKVKFYLSLACVPGEQSYTELNRLLPEVEAIRKASLKIPVEHQSDDEDDAEDTSRPKGGIELEVEAERLGNMTHTLTIHALPPDKRPEDCPPLVKGPCALDKTADVLVSGNYPRLNFRVLVEAMLLPEVSMPNAAEWSGKACYLTLVQTQQELEPGDKVKPGKRKKAGQMVLTDAVVMTPAKVAEMREVEERAQAPQSAGPEDARPAKPTRPGVPSLDDARASWADGKGAILLTPNRKLALSAALKIGDCEGPVDAYLDEAESIALALVRPGSKKDQVRAPIAHAWCVVGPNADGWIAVPVVAGKAAALNPELGDARAGLLGVMAAKPESTASSEWMAAVSASDEAGAPEVEFATLNEAELKALDRQALEGGRTRLDEFLAPLTLEQLRAQHFASGAGPCRATSADFVRHAIANHCRGRGIR